MPAIDRYTRQGRKVRGFRECVADKRELRLCTYCAREDGCKVLKAIQDLEVANGVEVGVWECGLYVSNSRIPGDAPTVD